VREIFVLAAVVAIGWKLLMIKPSWMTIDYQHLQRPEDEYLHERKHQEFEGGRHLKPDAFLTATTEAR
jgi:hypothetical protein